ncbi:MAG: TonB-dependent receptor [Gemmatimonadales bacterium]|nr:TonB-dependent receptor [Gemmatimonadales bacterium]
MPSIFPLGEPEEVCAMLLTHLKMVVSAVLAVTGLLLNSSVILADNPGSVPALAQPASPVGVGADSTVTHQASEIIVTASRYDEAVHLSHTNISAEDLKLREPDQELPLLLQDIPGVYSYSDAGSGLGYTYLKIRGFDQRRVGVLVNGIPFNDPEDHNVWWVNLPDLAASLQDVQVQRGVTNSIGGLGSIGGTVNLITAPPAREQSGGFTMAGGSYGFRQGRVNYHTGDLGHGLRSQVRVSQQESEGYRLRSGSDQWAVFWSGLHETEKISTRVNIYTGHELTHHSFDSSPASALAEDRKHNPETYENAVDDFRQPHYELHNTIYLNDDLTLLNSVYYTQGEGFYENFKDGETPSDYGLNVYLGLADVTVNDEEVEVDLVRRKWVRKDQVGWVPRLVWQQDKGRLVIGGDAYTFHSNHWGDVLQVDGFTADELNGTELKYYGYTGDKEAYSVYANQRLEVAPGLTLTADLQIQHKEYSFLQERVANFVGDLRNAYTVKYDFFNPKASVHWQIPGRPAGGRLATYASVGINRREPSDSDLFDVWDGPDDLGVQPLFESSRELRNPDGSIAYLEWSDPRVKEEKVLDTELGLSWAGSNLSFTLGGYWMDFTDEIIPYGGVDEDGAGIQGNAGKTLHRGLELGLRARLIENHELSVAASRSWDEFDEFIFHDYDGAETDLSGQPIALFPEYLVMAGWRTEWPGGLSSNLRMRKVGRQQLDNTGTADRSIDPWTTVDLSLWFDLSRLGIVGKAKPTVFFHLRNLGDVEYETTGYYNQWGGADFSGENHYTAGPGRNFATGVSATF